MIALKGGTETTTMANKRRKLTPRPNPYAVCRVTKDYANVNAATSAEFNEATHVCPKCKVVDYKSGATKRVAYSHKRNLKREHCDECDGDRIALLAIELERAGINLGWGYHSSDSHSAEYIRERHQYKATRTRLQQDAKEV